MHKLAVLLAAALAVGCGSRPEPAGYGASDARAYVREHRAELEEEVNVGSGASINQLSIVAGCQNLAEMNRTLRRNRSEIFGPPTATDEEVADRMVELLAERPELRCLDLELSRQGMFTAGRRHIGPGRHTQR